MRRGGEKKSNIFKRFYTIFKRFISIFERFYTVFKRFQTYPLNPTPYTLFLFFVNPCKILNL
jgi:hypothetical protein